MAVELQDNVVNRELGPDEPKFKIWSSAGLMLSYSCPSRCACCYVFSGPDAGSAATEMSVEQALEHWRALIRLAGDRAKVHLTGGEPFADYQRLKAILQAAGAENLPGLEKIETNAYWCTDEDTVRRRLRELRELGLRRLQISTDIYHQQFVPIERVRLAARVAAEVLGPPEADERPVQIRWEDFAANPVLVAAMDETARLRAFRETLQRRGERMLGRAAEELADLLPQRPYQDYQDCNCRGSFLGARHVHIDGAANICSGTCVGIILARGSDKPLDQIWRSFDYREHPIISVLVEKGPVGLLQSALEAGYQPRAGYASKCHLCYHLRTYLYPANRYPLCLGPAVCYGRG